MSKRLFACVLLISAAVCLSAAGADIFSEADRLYEEESYQQGMLVLEQLLPTLTSDADKAGCNWRLARMQLFDADDAERAGASEKELLKLFKKGEAYGSRAIELEPSADAYYWRTSNIGRWGEVKGILSSLSKADPMRKDLIKVLEYDDAYADAWYVLGRLYQLLPGGFISFGDVNYAVSYARRCIDVYDGEAFKISYYKSLGEALWKRDWSAGKLNKEIKSINSRYKKGKSAYEKMRGYEGHLGKEYVPEYMTSTLTEVSDREEAVKILSWVIGQYDQIEQPTNGEKNTIAEVRELLDSWR